MQEVKISLQIGEITHEIAAGRVVLRPPDARESDVVSAKPR